MIVFGIILVPVILLINFKLNKGYATKKRKRLLDILLLGISLIYLILYFNIEPYQFQIDDASDYLLYSFLIICSSPFMWVVIYIYLKKLFKKMRIHKNAKIKTNKEYKYYRDDLNKISPSTLMFISLMELDIKRCLSSTILKLKLLGYILEKNNAFLITDKNIKDLSKSDQMVLEFIKSKRFDEKKYLKEVEKETLQNKYLKKNKCFKFVKIIKIIVACFIPFILLNLSFKFDKYVFDNYRMYHDDDGRYLEIKDYNEVEKLYHKVKNPNHYRHRTMYDGSTYYEYNYIRLDKLQYSIVRKALFLHIFDVLLIGLSSLSFLIIFFFIIDQIKYFRKNYIRTSKGTEVLNKAYALKNYLKDFSLIKKRNEEELILWEYYLIYAVILDVNVEIQDKLIEKYI